MLAFLAAVAVIEHDYRIGVPLAVAAGRVDATDGCAGPARATWRSGCPWFSGAKLDDLVDYLTYVFVPALFVWRALLVPDGVGDARSAARCCSSSGFGFSRIDAKTADHFFTGFPSYWNIVVLVPVRAGTGRRGSTRWSCWRCAVLVFVPIRYVYPSRTPVLPVLTNGAGSGLGGRRCWRCCGDIPTASRGLVLASLVFPVYYVALSLFLQFRRLPAPTA